MVCGVPSTRLAIAVPGSSPDPPYPSEFDVPARALATRDHFVVVPLLHSLPSKMVVVYIRHKMHLML